MQIRVDDANLSNYFKPEIMSDARVAELYAGKDKALEAIMEIRNNITTSVDGFRCIQVQPTFLYESLWNLALLIILILIWRYKKFNGEIVLLYLFGYGLGRLWIEGHRTDQLLFPGTSVAVSQVLAGVLVVFAVVCETAVLIKRKKSAVAEK